MKWTGWIRVLETGKFSQGIGSHKRKSVVTKVTISEILLNGELEGM